jgi:hypothetical protein
MNHDRFSDILKAWHWHDYSKLTRDELKDKRDNDPFWPVQDFANDLEEKYRNSYHCGQRLDIDEQTVPSKHRHKCRCFNPQKPWKFHFKIFSLNCKTFDGIFYPL